MGQQRQTKTIDGHTYTVQQLGGMAAVKMLHRIGRGIGPAAAAAIGGLGTMLEGDKAPTSIADVDLSKLAPVLERTVGELFAKLSEADLEALIRGLLAGATVQGDEEGKEVEVMRVFEVHFQGRTMAVLSLVVFAIEVNYGSFSDVLRDAAAKYMPARKAAGSSSSKTFPQTSQSAGPAGA